jgi:predicted dehydrogenase
MDTEGAMINAGILGLGGWGQRLVGAVQGKDARLRFTTAVVRAPAKVAAFAETHRLAVLTDYRAMLNDPKIDAVVIATPHTLHAQQAIAAAKAGKPVFVEKPFTLTKDSAIAVAESCRSAGVPLGFGYNRRFLPAMAAFKRMIEEGRIGKVLQIEANISSNTAHRQAPDAWRATRAESPAGGMTSLGIHALDAMIHLGGAIKQVEAYSRRLAAPIDVDDSTTVLFQFDRGALGYLGTNFASAPYWRLQVFGDQGWIEMRSLDSLTVAARDGTIEEFKFPARDVEYAELDAFAAAISHGTPFPIPVDEIVHGVAVLEAIGQSAEVARAVVVP